MVRNLRKEKEILARKLHVLKPHHTPRVMSNSGEVLKWHRPTNWFDWVDTWSLPLFNIWARTLFVPPGRRSGRHRHVAEACFYIVEGRGYEIHDGVRWEWEVGDVMCVPIFCDHQHFTYPDQGAEMLAVTAVPYGALGIGELELIEASPELQLEEEYRGLMGLDERATEREAARVRAASLVPGDTATIYDGYLALLKREVAWRQNCPHVVKGARLPWGKNRMGRMKWLVHPSVPTGLLALDAWLQETPPGGRSGRHRHTAEEFHLILEGRGYDLHDGVHWNWEKGDVVAVPVRTEHQHFNADPYRPALFFAAQTRIHAFLGLGGIEHLEDAPS